MYIESSASRNITQFFNDLQKAFLDHHIFLLKHEPPSVFLLRTTTPIIISSPIYLEDSKAGRKIQIEYFRKWTHYEIGHDFNL